MTDLLQRVQHAIPGAEAWIEDLLAAHRADSVRVIDTEFGRLRDYFPASLLEAARVATVEELPVLPVAHYGVPEFEAMANMPAAAITFGNMFFLRDGDSSEGIHFHELVHVVQWRVLGVRDFLLTYAAGLLQHGYADSPLEAIAFELQGRFDHREPIENILALVEAHAIGARASAAALFARHGAAFDV